MDGNLIFTAQFFESLGFSGDILGGGDIVQFLSS